MAVATSCRVDRHAEVLKLCDAGEGTRAHPDHAGAVQKLDHGLVDVNLKTIGPAEVPQSSDLSL